LNIPDATDNLPSNNRSVSHLTQCLLLHYQGNVDHAKYALNYAKTWKKHPQYYRS